MCRDVACAYARADVDESGRLEFDEAYDFVSDLSSEAHWATAERGWSECAGRRAGPHASPEALDGLDMSGAAALLRCMYGEQLDALM